MYIDIYTYINIDRYVRIYTATCKVDTFHLTSVERCHMVAVIVASSIIFIFILCHVYTYLYRCLYLSFYSSLCLYRCYHNVTPPPVLLQGAKASNKLVSGGNGVAAKQTARGQSHSHQATHCCSRPGPLFRGRTQNLRSYHPSYTSRISKSPIIYS